jgi:high affinity Mn2+ porin
MRYLTLSVIIGMSLPAIAGAAAGEAPAAPTSPPAFTWAGFYIGANMGVGIPLHTSERFQAVSGFASGAFDLYPDSRERSGIAFGAQVGHNWQFGDWVVGLETDINLLDGRRGPSGTFVTPAAYWPLGVGSYTVTADPSGTYFGSFRGRLGFAVDRTLFYVTGGVATGGWRGASTLTLNGGALGNPFTTGLSQSSRMKYILGAGIEYAFAGNWSARAEYAYLNQSLNTQVFDNGNSFDYASRTQSESHILRFGMNYHFGEDGGSSESTNSKDTKSDGGPERYSMHGQTTVLAQGYPKFRALYSGSNSLSPPWGQARATVSSTGFFGLRLWEGGEAYVNPEVDEGFGLNSTFGLAGFPSAEAYKVGRAAPYLRSHRYFLRQTIGLGGESEQIASGQNQLAGSVDANRFTFTIGKYAVVDIFDDNKYAHDGRNGFMNWSVVDMGAFDYAADAWGFTHGATAEWKQDWWTVRGGLFQMPQVPNGEVIEPVLFRQFSQIVEFEARYSLFGQPGKIKFLGFGDLEYCGKWEDAINFGVLTGTTPDITQNPKKRFKAGGGVNIEQPLTEDLGFFLRASMNNDRYQALAFTEIKQSFSAGLVLTGVKWDRPKDAIGLAGVINGISNSHAAYLAAGGLGSLLGDGALSYGGEHIIETYYKFNVIEGVHVTADYQFADNPGYNRDRGPVSLFAVRLHAEF